MEKNRRAHLKECYEHLKNELPVKKDEDRRKTSNLAILGEAHKLVEVSTYNNSASIYRINAWCIHDYEVIMKYNVFDEIPKDSMTRNRNKKARYQYLKSINTN